MYRQKKSLTSGFDSKGTKAMLNYNIFYFLTIRKPYLKMPVNDSK